MPNTPPGTDASVERADPVTEVSFEADGETWLARIAGVGAAGWGTRGVAPFEAVHFHRAGESRPRFEALLGRGRLPWLHTSELQDLLRRASPVPPAS